MRKSNVRNITYQIGLSIFVLGLLLREFVFPNAGWTAYFLPLGAFLYLYSWISIPKSELPIRKQRHVAMAVLSGFLLLLAGIALVLELSWWKMTLAIALPIVIYSNLAFVLTPFKPQN